MSTDWKVMRNAKDKASIKREGCFGVDPRPVYVAIIDGVATLLDIFPEPRARTIRAFKCRPTEWTSVESALAHDGFMLGQDMWAAIRSHEHEEATEEADLSTTGHTCTR